MPEGGSRVAQRVRDLELTNEKLSVLLETSRLLASEVSLDRLLQLTIKETTRVLDAERSSLFLLDRERGELWSKIAEGIDDTILRFPVGKGLAGHVARTGEVINIPDAYADERFNPASDRRTGYRTRSLLVVPLKNRLGEVLGVVQVLNKRHGTFTREDEDLLLALGAQAGISIENALLYERIEALFDAFVRTIVAAIDERDPTTSGHSHRVAEYALNLARSLHNSDEAEAEAIRFTREELRALRYASILHDVGKIGVREAVLCKRYTLLVPELALVEEKLRRAGAEAELAALRAGRPADPEELAFFARLLEVIARRRFPCPLQEGEEEALARARAMGLLTERQFSCFMLREGNLNGAEWVDMRSHVSRSYQLLSQIPWPEPLARVPAIAGAHHEKLDGSGYPRGLKKEEVPFEGQILTVADIYDALTASDRPYKRSYNREEARGILEEEVGKNRLAALLVRTFFEMGCYELPLGVPLPPPQPPPDPPL